MKRLSNTWINTIIFSILTLTLCLVGFDVYSRLKLESEQQTKEIAITFNQLHSLSIHSLQDISTVLASIKQSEAISTVILDERSIQTFITNGQATLLTGYEIENSLRIGQNYRSLISHLKKRGGIKKQNIYLVVDQYKNYNHIKDTLILTFSPELIKERGFNILELSTTKSTIESIPVGFDTKLIQQLHSHGFNVIPRFAPNPSASKQLVQFKFQQLEKIDSLYTIALKPPYLGSNQHSELIVQSALDNNYKLLFSRTYRDKSLLELAKKSPKLLLSASEAHISLGSQHPLSAHSILDQHTHMTLLNLKYSGIPAINILPTVNAFLSQLKSDLNYHHIQLTKEFVYPASNYSGRHFITTLCLTVSLLILLHYILSKFVFIELRYQLFVTGLYLFSFVSTSYLLSPIVWDRVLMLLTVIMFSTLSLIEFYPLQRNESPLKESILFFIKTLTFCSLGGAIILSITFKQAFLIGYAQFYGVSLSIIISLLLSSYYFIMGPERIRSGFYIVKRALLAPINSMTVISFIVVILLITSFWFRESIAILNLFERYLDSLFDSIQFLRPRFKEFAVGFPALLMAVYGQGLLFPKRWTWFFIGLGSLGLVSLLHSFCIVNTPIVITLGQTIIAAASGFLFFLLYLSITVLFKQLLSSD